MLDDMPEDLKKAMMERIRRSLCEDPIWSPQPMIRVGAPHYTELMAQAPEATTLSLNVPANLEIVCTIHNKSMTTDDEGKPICWDCYKARRKNTQDWKKSKFTGKW